MDIRQVQYFLKIAATGNFTVAAEDLYISQSSLSKQIIALEKELDVRLFDRSRRKIALTEAGKVFRKHANQLNTEYLTTLADLSDYRSSPSFSIVSIPVIAPYGIPGYLAHFRRAYPHLAFTLEEQEASLILPALDELRYDLAFLRDIYVDAERYSWVQIAHDQLLVAVSTTHRLAHRRSVALDELAGESFIMPAKGTLVHELAVDACHRAGFQPRITYTSLRAASILGMVATNSGIALMMQQILRYSSHPDVVAIPLDASIDGNVVLAWLKHKKLSTPARAFVDFVGRELAT